jgi:hypothetical protein
VDLLPYVQKKVKAEQMRRAEVGNNEVFFVRVPVPLQENELKRHRLLQRLRNAVHLELVRHPDMDQRSLVFQHFTITGERTSKGIVVTVQPPLPFHPMSNSPSNPIVLTEEESNNLDECEANPPPGWTRPYVAATKTLTFMSSAMDRDPVVRYRSPF